MDNGQKTLIGLFNSDRNFIIPKYQRTYAWEKKQLSDFLEDIHNLSNDKKRSYFLGTVLFEEKDSLNSYEQIEIVDGQQRITTIVIFMKCLIQLYESILDDMSKTKLTNKFLKDEYYHRLQVIDIDDDFFKTYIIGNKKPIENSFSTPSQKRLWFAKQFFKNQLENKVKQFSIEILGTYINKIKSSKILTYSVNNPEEATLIFETTNDRGKSLTNLEKTKSFLMYQTYLSVEKPDEYIKSIHDKFRNIYLSLDKIDNRLKEDAVLQYHFIGFENWRVNKKVKEYQKYMNRLKEKVNSLSNNHNDTNIRDYIKEYTFEVKESFSRFLSVLEDKNSYLRDVFILGRVGNFYPLINKALSYDKSDKTENFYKVIQLIEQYSFRVYAINNKKSNKGQSAMFTLARDFKGDFQGLINTLKNKIQSDCPQNDFERKLASSHFYKEVRKGDQNYLFWKYENYLRTNFQPKVSNMSETEFLNDDTKLKLTIEHITAQKGINGLKFTDISSEEFEEKHIHSIGNLTIDPKSSNSSKGKNIWDDKNKRYFEKAPFKTQLELSEYVDVNVVEWNEKSIEKRGKDIIDFAIKYWNPDNIKIN